MSALSQILDTYRQISQTEREKGTYFEELIRTYFRYEATYADLYEQVWLYSDWAKEHPEFGLSAKDTGIDLVAKSKGTDEYHAIQCKCYAEDYRVQKKDIDSFFTASGQKPFTRRYIVATSNHWSENAEASLVNQQPPVQKIDLNALEESQIDWAKYQPEKAPELKEKKSLRLHQQSALVAVERGLATAERGKLIMACGTGKTFTSLKIAEKVAGKGKRVLFLIPSLSLLSQTLTEWTQESETPLHSFAVCSDSEVGKQRKKDDDAVNTFVHELRFPATTNSASLTREIMQRHDAEHMSVVFSTYHSIQVLSDAQQEYGLDSFDLIICDEAHRTTGATFDGDEESAFVKVHDNDFLKANKRLYMTATPRIYGDAAKAKEDTGVTLCSMDDKGLYGEELFVINFSEAVQRGLLCDYKVIVLAIDEHHVNTRLQNLLRDENNSLKVDDAAKIVGCWKALAKIGLHDELDDDPLPMQRAVAFCQVIEANNVGKAHKVSSKQIAQMFSAVVEEYQRQADEEEIEHGTLKCSAEHIDGGMNATEKENKINWLKAQPEPDSCKILSNVRCLSEGVDVPALDAVLFLTPRNSQVDVVQSVGRVMRNAPGKKKGYVVLPVVIPAGMQPEEALNDNKVYKVVWDVLQALRSHDDSFDAMINKLDLMDKRPAKMEVIAVTGDVKPKIKTTNDKKKKAAGQAKGGDSIGNAANNHQPPEQAEIQFEVGAIERALHAKLVKKCGNRLHWEQWANDIAKIANTHISRITAIVQDPANSKEKAAFDAFAEELRDDLNDAISDAEVIEMLAQHLITKPVFDALFKDYSFASHNPVSLAMQSVLETLQEHHLDKERDTLESFYASVQMRADGIDNAQGKQKIVVELYDKFFRNAFPRMTERLGIVYTPVEVVDFIIHSVNHLLQKEFNQTLGSKGVHIIDPFTGTGTFITRLLQSGLIKPEELKHKYQNEIHANELVLLAYYIAAINIEAAYHDLAGDEYLPFEGICLTDTFQMYEKDDLISEQLVENSERRKRQKALDIRVIIGNPPYSAGQESANDNNANIKYPGLDAKIRDTYAARSTAINKNALYDSYIRAIRWASDRVGDSGIIGFVTNAGFIETSTSDGMRKCLAEEFSSLYIFHLRGNARTSGEQRRKEKDNIFESGSRAPIAVSLLVKNPDATEHGKIYFHDIGDYLTREEKLSKTEGFVSIDGVSEWQTITPDEHGDWLNQRDDGFSGFIVIGAKSGLEEKALFSNYSNGLKTQRDAWCFNASQRNLVSKMQATVDFYQREVKRFSIAHGGAPKNERKKYVDDFVSYDPSEISWTRALKNDLASLKSHNFKDDCLLPSNYRPFYGQWLYFDRAFNEMVYQMPRIFPTPESHNLCISIEGSWRGEGNLALISNKVFCQLPDGGNQCFPLYIYDELAASKSDGSNQSGLFDTEEPETQYQRRDAITDEGLKHFQEAYPAEQISKEDIFYYVYGLLHSQEYRDRYADNLSKELPRIPRVKTAEGFWGFSKAGRELAHWHLNYETIEPYKATVEEKDDKSDKVAFYRVEKMKHPKVKNEEGKSVNDLTKVIYNSRITVSDIPVEAYDYVVNGKPAIEWVIERQCVKTDKDSGIVNDANDWANETMNDPRYPLDLLLRVIRVSLETNRIVAGLPALDID
jgi:predicted helicase